MTGENSLHRRDSSHSTRPRGLYVQGVGGTMRITIGKELCGVLLGSSTSAYRWVGVIRNGSWCRECSVFPRIENPSNWVQADGSLVPPSTS